MRILNTEKTVVHRIDISDRELLWLLRVAEDAYHTQPDRTRGILSEELKDHLISVMREIAREG